MGIGFRRFHSHGFNVLHQLGELGFAEVHSLQHKGLAVINVSAVGVQLEGAGGLVRIQFAQDDADFHPAAFGNLGGEENVNDQRFRVFHHRVQKAHGRERVTGNERDARSDFMIVRGGDPFRLFPSLSENGIYTVQKVELLVFHIENCLQEGLFAKAREKWRARLLASRLLASSRFVKLS